MTIANNHRTEPLHLWGGKGLERIVRGLTVICGPLSFELVLHELPFKESAHFTTGALEWTTQPVKHRVPCLAYSCHLPRAGRFDVERAKACGIPVQLWSILQKGERVEHDGRIFQPEDVLGPARRGLRLSYATDCRPAPALAELVRESDLFVAEGLYGDPAKQPDAAAKGHMVYTEAAAPRPRSERARALVHPLQPGHAQSQRISAAGAGDLRKLPHWPQSQDHHAAF